MRGHWSTPLYRFLLANDKLSRLEGLRISKDAYDVRRVGCWRRTIHGIRRYTWFRMPRLLRMELEWIAWVLVISCFSCEESDWEVNIIYEVWRESNCLIAKLYTHPRDSTYSTRHTVFHTLFFHLFPLSFGSKLISNHLEPILSERKATDNHIYAINSWRIPKFPV